MKTGSSRQANHTIWLLFSLLVLLKASAYWIGASIQWPEDPFSTIVLYRGKDIESFPILKNLGSLQFGEPGLYEGHNEGVLSDRFIPWIPHAVLFRWLGAAGFVVADLLLTPLRFLLLAFLFRLCGLSTVISVAAGAVLTCVAIDDFGEGFPRLAGIPIRFWGLRLPRPFISEFFMLLAMIGALSAMKGLREQNRSSRASWILAGAALALLFQSDFYTATGLAIAFAVILALELFKRRKSDWQKIAVGAGLSLGAALLASFPGILQSLFTNPEGMIRLGLFTVSRWSPPFIDAAPWYAASGLLCITAWILTRWEKNWGSTASGVPARTLLLASCAGALAAMPLTSAVVGKAIELYHYRDSFTRYLSLALALFALQAMALLWKRYAGSSRRAEAGPRWAVAAPAAVLCAFFIWQFATVTPARAGHMRPDYPEWGAIEDYRRPFVELVKELSQPAYDDKLVLGTYDHQVWSWWVTFRDGYSYLADACTTNISADELERRATELAKVLGMSRAQFEAFARRHYVMIFWMSCSKYQATPAYTYSTVDDYTAEDQLRIRQTPAYLNFTVALPLSQQKRLGDLFDTVGPKDTRRLDLVVVTKDGSLTGLAPSAEEFRLSFENRLFSVWVRRTAASDKS